jgi:hypothetical protein
MTRAQDQARRINPYLSILHHLWAEHVLGISYKPGNGVDLYDSATGNGIEIKFARNEKNTNNISWTVNKEQLEYIEQCTHFFWGCGIHHPIPLLKGKYRSVNFILLNQHGWKEPSTSSLQKENHALGNGEAIWGMPLSRNSRALSLHTK